MIERKISFISMAFMLIGILIGSVITYMVFKAPPAQMPLYSITVRVPQNLPAGNMTLRLEAIDVMTGQCIPVYFTDTLETCICLLIDGIV